MLSDRMNAVVNYVLHNLYPNLHEGSPVSTIKKFLEHDQAAFAHLVHELTFRNMGTFSIEEEIERWKKVNTFCNAALHNHSMRDIDAENISAFQNRVNEYANLLSEIHSCSDGNLRVAVLLVNRQTFLFMNALWDIASERPELELISRLEHSFYAMFATNRDFRDQGRYVYYLKDRNTNKETELLASFIYLGHTV